MNKRQLDQLLGGILGGKAGAGGEVSLAVQVALEQMLAELAPLPDYSVTLVVARPTAMPMLQLAPRMLRARARLVLETPLPA
jgi:hypothetical protein